MNSCFDYNRFQNRPVTGRRQPISGLKYRHEENPSSCRTAARRPRAALERESLAFDSRSGPLLRSLRRLGRRVDWADSFWQLPLPALQDRRVACRAELAGAFWIGTHCLQHAWTRPPEIVQTRLPPHPNSAVTSSCAPPRTPVPYSLAPTYNLRPSVC